MQSIMIKASRAIINRTSYETEQDEAVFLHVAGIGRLKVESIEFDDLAKEIVTVYTSAGDGEGLNSFIIPVCSALACELPR